MSTCGLEWRSHWIYIQLKFGWSLKKCMQLNDVKIKQSSFILRAQYEILELWSNMYIDIRITRTWISSVLYWILNVSGFLVITFYITTYPEKLSWKKLFNFLKFMKIWQKICLFWSAGRRRLKPNSSTKCQHKKTQN